MKKFVSLFIAVLLAVALLAPATVSAEPSCPPPCEPPKLINGSFEYPVVGGVGWNIFDSGSEGLGWTVEWVPGSGGGYSPAHLELHNIQALGVTPPDGSQYAELDTDWDGPGGSISGESASVAISQMINTCEDQCYQVTFYYLPRPGHLDNGLAVYWNDNLVFSVTNPSVTEWAKVVTAHLSGVSGKTETKLKFVETGTADSLGMFLDNVSVIIVPCTCEPPKLINGSFEHPVVRGVAGWNIFGSGSEGLGWTVEWVPGSGGGYSPARLELHNIQALGVTPYDGSQYAELDTDWGGPGGLISGEAASVAISQMINTCEDKFYQVTFYYLPRPGHLDNGLAVYWNDNLVFSITNPSVTEWTEVVITDLSGASGKEKTKLKFVETGTADSLGMFLDNVSVEFAP